MCIYTLRMRLTPIRRLCKAKRNLIKKRNIIFFFNETIQTFTFSKKKKNKRRMSGCYDITTYFLRMDEIFHGESRCKDFFHRSRWKSSRENERFCRKSNWISFSLAEIDNSFFFFLVRRDVNRLEYLLQFLRKRFSIAILDPVLSQRGGNRHEWTDIFLSFFFFFFVRNGSRLSLSRNNVSVVWKHVHV